MIPMKKHDDQPELTPEEKLKAENELLKMKLTAEFGMNACESKLHDAVENEWLNYIYNFEKLHQDANKIKVYDFIGKPEFKKIGELTKDEITSELDRLLDVIEKSAVAIYFCCDYDDETVYKFITEELFEEMIDNIRIEGMRTCFTYEEFHPNHDYDLRELAKDFFTTFLEKNWDAVYASHQLFENIQYNDRNIDRKDFVKILLSFKEHVKPIRIDSFQINSVDFSMETKLGIVIGTITYEAQAEISNKKNYSGQFKLISTFNDFYWAINQITFPEFN